MSNREPAYHFKVQWRFPKSKAATADYVAGSLRELLSLLKKQEDVSMGTTELLCIHQITADGGVKELLYHEMQSVIPKAEAEPKTNVIPITRTKERVATAEKVVNDSLARIASKDKPRVKAGRGKIVHAAYLYTAIEAIP